MWPPEAPFQETFDEPPRGGAGGPRGPYRCPRDGQALRRLDTLRRRRSAVEVYRCPACGYEYRRQAMSKNAVFGGSPGRLR